MARAEMGDSDLLEELTRQSDTKILLFLADNLYRSLL